MEKESEVPREPARFLEIRRSTGYSYLLYLPEEYESQPLWPWMLFLHGVGERGADLELVKAQGLPLRLDEGRDLPFVVVAPQCPAGNYWSDKLLLSLLDDVAAERRVDPDRLYLTGLSMGGYAAWSLAQAQPFRFAAMAPVCGGGDARRVGKLRRLPVWAFHGARDKVVRPSESSRLVEALQRCGGDARLTIYPEAGHDAWTKTYEGVELYQWFLGQRRRNGMKACS